MFERDLFIKTINDTKKCIDETNYILEQFNHLLDSWPLSEGGKMKEMNFIGGDLTPSIYTSSKTDEIYVTTRKEFDSIFFKFKELKGKFDKNLTSNPSRCVNVKKNGVNEILQNDFIYYTYENVMECNECVEIYKNLIENLNNLS